MTPPVEMPVLDLDTIQQIRELQVEGEPDLLVRLIDLFMESTPKSLEAIRVHAEGKAPQKLIESAHYLKSSCFALGASKMGSVCAHVEEMGKSRRYDQVQLYLSRLEAEYTKLVTVLESLKK